MSSKVNSVHLPTATEFKNNTMVMLRTILLTTQALEQLPGESAAITVGRMSRTVQHTKHHSLPLSSPSIMNDGHSQGAHLLPPSPPLQPQHPELCTVALKVYFNDTVPADFNPEGYVPATSADGNADEPDAFSFQRAERVRVNLGATATHHDALKLYMQTLQVG